MSSTLFPAGLVPFEDLFSKPPNPMLGPSLAQDCRPGLDQEGCGKLSCPRSDPGLTLTTPPSRPLFRLSSSETWTQESPDPSQAPSPPHLEPTKDSQADDSCHPPSPPPLEPGPGGGGSGSSSDDFVCKPGLTDPGPTERPPPGASPRWDFGDLFCKPPNPMLSPTTAGAVTYDPPPLASPSPRPASGQEGCQVPLSGSEGSQDGTPCRPGLGEARPRNRNGQGSGPRPDGKRRSKEAGASAAKGRVPPEEDFAQLLERYRREREAPEEVPVSPAPPAPPPSEGKVKKKSKRNTGAGRAGRAKPKKRAGPARDSKPLAGPAATQERAPVSQEFVQKNTVALGSQRGCKYFLAGWCVLGEQCSLDHLAEGLKFQQLCKFYVQGYCTRGDQCSFLHHEFPCKFFHTGAKCYQGEHCGFSHAPLTPETESLLRTALAGPAPTEATAPPAPL
ncbi:uncharacterized protein LOC141510167 [Macrotis lagotis]|uniref:uncharacterized protein LOC141510167 n=1 Tax=Macrotis lagotis TaxID=92651 RepID=UPI003D68146A